ncbi:hypothetical protein [Nostoc sp.]
MYLVDGKVCSFIDARYKHERLSVSGVVLRFTQAIPVGAPIPPMGEFILKTWDTDTLGSDEMLNEIRSCPEFTPALIIAQKRVTPL